MNLMISFFGILVFFFYSLFKIYITDIILLIYNMLMQIDWFDVISSRRYHLKYLIIIIIIIIITKKFWHNTLVHLNKKFQKLKKKKFFFFFNFFFLLSLRNLSSQRFHKNPKFCWKFWYNLRIHLSQCQFFILI